VQAPVGFWDPAGLCLCAAGASAQTSTSFWDPAGFAADGSVQNFARRRQTEIKHGRISMLAAMGYIAPELAGKLPG
jgi:hypothetical protein